MGTSAPQTMPATSGDCATYYMMIASGGISAQMGAAVRFDTHVDEARLARALRLLLDTEPVLGYRFVAGPGVPAWRRVELAEGEDLLPILETTDPDADAAAFAASDYDPCAGPQVRGLLLRSPHCDTLTLQVSHVAVDGRGVIETLYRLAQIHRTLCDDPAWEPPFNERADRSFAPAAAGVGLRDRVRSMKSLTSLTEPGEWPRQPDSEKRGREAYFVGVVEPAVFRAIKDKGRARGATVNDLLLNAYHRSMCRMLRPAPGACTPVLMTADLREYLPADSPRGLSGFAAFWGVDLPPAGAEDFDVTLSRAVERTSAWKSGGMARQKAIGSGSAEAMTGGRRLKLVRPMYIKMGDVMKKSMESGSAAPMLTNIGVINEQQLDFGGGLHADRCRWFPPIAAGPGSLGAAMFRERLEICMGADPKATDPDLAHAIVDGVVEELEDWARRQ